METENPIYAEVIANGVLRRLDTGEYVRIKSSSGLKVGDLFVLFEIAEVYERCRLDGRTYKEARIYKKVARLKKAKQPLLDMSLLKRMSNEKKKKYLIEFFSTRTESDRIKSLLILVDNISEDEIKGNRFYYDIFQKYKTDINTCMLLS